MACLQSMDQQFLQMPNVDRLINICYNILVTEDSGGFKKSLIIPPRRYMYHILFTSTRMRLQRLILRGRFLILGNKY